MQPTFPTLIAVLGAAMLAPSMAEARVPLEEIGTYSRDAHDRTLTKCDELAGHPDDPERVTDGVSRAEMDLEAATLACTEAVNADPANPRLNYQLARVYGYAGRHVDAQPYRDAALKAGYPQSLFVIGYIRLLDWDGQGKDACYGGELIRRSADAGRFAGLVGFPHYALRGEFDTCPNEPARNTQAMLGYLDNAASQTTDFYKTALIEQLKARLEAGDLREE